MTEPNELTTLARRLGSHPARLVLGSEGAVAEAHPGGKFSVSAAGANLGRLGPEDIVKFDLPAVQALLAQDPAQDDAAQEALNGAIAEANRPQPAASVFLFADLFALEGVKFAAHTQPVPVNQILCSPRARQFSDRRNLPDEILACGVASVLVPFLPPGLALAREAKRKLMLWQDRLKGVPKLILLQNNGMIALGESVEEVVTITEMTVKFAEIFIGAAMLGGPDFLKPNVVTEIDATRAV